MSGELFQWECQPEAEKFTLELLKEAKQLDHAIASFEKQLYQESSTHLFDWLDHIVISHTEGIEAKIENLGFVSDAATSHYRVFYHPGAHLPRIIVTDHESFAVGLALKVDSIQDFLMVRGITGSIEGSPFSRYRRCEICSDGVVNLSVIERRGSLTMEPVYEESGYLSKYMEAKQKWMTRPRLLEDEQEAMRLTINLAEKLVEMVGQDLAAHIVLEVERMYWQSKNRAGQLQKNRQDSLGMGWANHDHHTFRSSRRHFTQLIRLFEILGFHCRERFYAGDEAGWGAQVMENTRAGIVLFCDVDLKPVELSVDFAHHEISENGELGTVGLWCALHGDSILGAGMHHLEAQFDFESLATDLKRVGIDFMDPFSNFSYLKQAFSKGEIWPVEKKRVEKLLSEGLIDKDLAKKFLEEGAIGSHLENLQRKEGYKGFNKHNVSTIIRNTDPRK